MSDFREQLNRTFEEQAAALRLEQVQTAALHAADLLASNSLVAWQEAVDADPIGGG